MRVDVVTAVRSEEATIPLFVARVRALALPDDVELRLLFVEDTSDDGTVPLLRKLASEDPSIRYWSLERGYGQGPAIVYGVARARADAVVMLDVDGSHPVEVIPEMIERFRAGARVVQCRRHAAGSRRRWRNVGSLAFGYLGRLLTGVDVAGQNIYFRLVSADTARMLVESPIWWRFLRIPLPEPGSDGLSVLDVETPDRALGESKYDFPRLLGLAVDGILSLMPRSRLVILAALGTLASVGLFAVGGWPLGLLLLVGVLWSARRHAALRTLDTLDRMRSVESSEGPGDVRAPEAGRT